MAANAIAVIVEHVELCNIVNKYWFVKVPVMLIELAAFYLIFYHMFYKKQEDGQEV